MVKTHFAVLVKGSMKQHQVQVASAMLVDQARRVLEVVAGALKVVGCFGGTVVRVLTISLCLRPGREEDRG